MQKSGQNLDIQKQSNSFNSDSVIAEHQGAEQTCEHVETNSKVELAKTDVSDLTKSGLVKMRQDEFQSKLTLKTIHKSLFEQPNQLAEMAPEITNIEIKNKKLTGSIALVISIVGLVLFILAIVALVLGFAPGLIFGALISPLLSLAATFMAILSIDRSKLAQIALIIANISLLGFILSISLISVLVLFSLAFFLLFILLLLLLWLAILI